MMLQILPRRKKTVDCLWNVIYKLSEDFIIITIQKLFMCGRIYDRDLRFSKFCLDCKKSCRTSENHVRQDLRFREDLESSLKR